MTITSLNERLDPVKSAIRRQTNTLAVTRLFDAAHEMPLEEHEDRREKLWKLTGIRVDRLADIENNGGHITLEEYMLLCSALHVDPVELMASIKSIPAFGSADVVRFGL